MLLRAKFKVVKRCQFEGHESLEAVAVTAGTPENTEFWRYTPNGTFMIACFNPTQLEDFHPGDEFYIDMTLCPKPATAQE